MRIVTAIDSFKGSLTSLQAGEAVREAALKLDATNEVLVRPLADGGEGTVDALTAGLGGEYVEITVTGPMHTPVKAKYGILRDGTAIMEMSAAAGIISSVNQTMTCSASAAKLSSMITLRYSPSLPEL